MILPEINQKNVGRISERIVANELNSRGFSVLNLNAEGPAANVDLIAAKDSRLWQIQVKGCTYDSAYEQDGWWFGYGYCTQEQIQNCDAPFFNRHPAAFRADVVVFVCVRNLKDYQCVILPIEIAEEAAKTNVAMYRLKKPDGSDHKPGKAWFSFYSRKARTSELQALLDRERELVTPFKEKWDFDLAPHVGSQPST